MRSKEQALNDVKAGDVIFGLGAGGQDKMLLVYKADQSGFSARHITTQMTFRFGRDGRTRLYADGGYVTIVSTAALPPEQLQVALGLDRKMGSDTEYPQTKLTKAEIDLLLTHVEYFKSRPLPQE